MTSPRATLESIRDGVKSVEEKLREIHFRDTREFDPWVEEEELEEMVAQIESLLRMKTTAVSEVPKAAQEVPVIGVGKYDG